MNKGDSALIMNSYMEYLRQSSLFKDFSKDEIETFLMEVEHKFIELKANEKYKLKKNRCLIVLSGLVISCVTNKNGRLDTIQGFSSVIDSFISETKIMNNMMRLPFTAKCDTLLLELNSDDFSSDTNEHIMLLCRFQQNVIRTLSETLARRDIRGWCSIAPSAREKVMRFLLYQYIVQGSEHLSIHVTRDEAASFMLIDTRTLFRELRNIKNDGIIDYKGRNITILKLEEVLKYYERSSREEINRNEKKN